MPRTTCLLSRRSPLWLFVLCDYVIPLEYKQNFGRHNQHRKTRQNQIQLRRERFQLIHPKSELRSQRYGIREQKEKSAIHHPGH